MLSQRLPAHGTQVGNYGSIPHSLHHPDLETSIDSTGPKNELLLNDGSGSFTADSTSAVVASTDRTYAAAFADVNGDKFVDLVVGNWGRANEYFLNGGRSGSTWQGFSKVSGSAISTTTLTVAVLFGDVDSDGDVDLFVANYRTANEYFTNNGQGVFTAVSGSAVTAQSCNRAGRDCSTLAMVLVDIDGDGDLGEASPRSRLVTLAAIRIPY